MKHILMVFLISFGFTSYSQDFYSITYFTKYDKQVYLKDSADYFRFIYKPKPSDEVVSIIEKYKNGMLKSSGFISAKYIPFMRYQGQRTEYLGNGKIKCIQNYLDGSLSGNTMYYYPNGKIRELGINHFKRGRVTYVVNQVFDSNGKSLLDSMGNGRVNYIDDSGNLLEGNYIQGLKDGIWTTKNIDSKLIFEDSYEKGVFINGSTYDSSGNKTNYKELLTYAHASFYSGSKKVGDFTNLVGRNADFDGLIVFTFDIDKLGEISNIRLLCSKSDFNDKKFLERIIKQKWHAKVVRGEPVNTYNYLYSLSSNQD